MQRCSLMAKRVMMQATAKVPYLTGPPPPRTTLRLDSSDALRAPGSETHAHTESARDVSIRAPTSTHHLHAGPQTTTITIPIPITSPASAARRGFAHCRHIHLARLKHPDRSRLRRGPTTRPRRALDGARRTRAPSAAGNASHSHPPASESGRATVRGPWGARQAAEGRRWGTRQLRCMAGPGRRQPPCMFVTAARPPCSACRERYRGGGGTTVRGPDRAADVQLDQGPASSSCCIARARLTRLPVPRPALPVLPRQAALPYGCRWQSAFAVPSRHAV